MYFVSLSPKANLCSRVGGLDSPVECKWWVMKSRTLLHVFAPQLVRAEMHGESLLCSHEASDYESILSRNAALSLSKFSHRKSDCCLIVCIFS